MLLYSPVPICTVWWGRVIALNLRGDTIFRVILGWKMNWTDKQSNCYAPWTIYQITCRNAEKYVTARINKTCRGEGDKGECVHSGLFHYHFPKAAWGSPSLGSWRRRTLMRNARLEWSYANRKAVKYVLPSWEQKSEHCCYWFECKEKKPRYDSENFLRISHRAITRRTSIC